MPPSASAATAPFVPRNARIRAPHMTSSTASATSAPITVSSTGSARCRVSQVPAGTVHTAAAHNGTIAATRTLRHPSTSPIRQITPEAQLARATPSDGPSSSTSAGTATSAKPIPVSHCTQAPSSMAPARKMSPWHAWCTPGRHPNIYDHHGLRCFSSSPGEGTAGPDDTLGQKPGLYLQTSYRRGRASGHPDRRMLPTRPARKRIARSRSAHTLTRDSGWASATDNSTVKSPTEC